MRLLLERHRCAAGRLQHGLSPARCRRALEPRDRPDAACQARHDQVAGAPGAARPAEALGRLHGREPRCIRPDDLGGCRAPTRSCPVGDPIVGRSALRQPVAEGGDVGAEPPLVQDTMAMGRTTRAPAQVPCTRVHVDYAPGGTGAFRRDGSSGSMGANAAGRLPQHPWRPRPPRGRTPGAGRPAQASAEAGGPGAASGSPPCGGCR